MKGKKLLSAFAALAMTVSAFAGLAVTADAATEKYVDNFDNQATATAWSGNADKGVVEDNATNNKKPGYSYYVTGASNGRQRPAWTTVSPTDQPMTGIINVNFNFRMDTSYNSTSPTQTIKLLSEIPTDANNDTAGKSILEFSQTTSDSGYTGKYALNGVEIMCLDTGDTKQSAARNTSGWINMDVTLDTNTKTFDIFLRRVTTNETNYTVSDDILYSAKNVVFKDNVEGLRALFVFSARYPSYNGGRIWFDDIKIDELDVPTLEFTAPEEIVVGTPEVIDITSNAVNGVTVSNTNTEKFKTSYANGKITIETLNGAVTGDTATITVVAQNADSREKNVKSFDVVAKDASAVASKVVVKFQDSDGNALKADETVSDNVFVGILYEATEAQKSEFEYVDSNDIVYTATLNVNSLTSVTPDSADGSELVLKFDLTEHTYTGTINTGLQYAKVDVAAATSKSGASVAAQTVYTDYQGKANVTAYNGTYSYTVSKSNYTTANGSLELASNDSVSSVTVQPTKSNLLWWEDFSTAGIENGLFGTQGSAGNKNNWNRIYNGGLQYIGGGSGNRTSTIPFGTLAGYGVYKIEFDFDIEQFNANEAGTTTLTLGSAVFTFESTTSSGKEVVNITANGTEIDKTQMSGKGISIVYDTNDNKTIATIGGVEAVKEGCTLPTEINLNLSRNHRALFDNIKITGEPSIEVMDNRVSEATLINQEVTPAGGGAPITVNGTAYTVWYKLNNFAEGTQPTITLKNSESTFNETATITQAEVGNNGYYCVQILGEGLAVGSYTITLTADGVSKEVTFTVAEGVDIPDTEI